MKLSSILAIAGLLLPAIGGALFAPSPARAVILVDQINPFANKIGPGGGDWDTAFTNALASQPGGYTIGQISDAAQVDAASAILVVYRNPFAGINTLSPTEITNLTDFLASGRRVVIIGEGNFFDTWNNSILAFASSMAGGSTPALGSPFNGNVSPIVSNALTAGVGTFNLQGGGIVTGGGGTALFDHNFATLWTLNLLTVLDAQVFRNLAAAGSGDAAFRENVADFLGEVPLPASLPLMLSVLGGGYLVGLLRRRKSRTSNAI
jgi:hypothetical protein